MAAPATDAYDVLVSFHPADLATVEDIEAKLRDAGIRALLAPSPWEPQWEKRWHASLYQTRVLLLLLGKGGTGVPKDAWPDVQNWIATRGGSFAPVFLSGSTDEQRNRLPSWVREGVWLDLRPPSEREKTLDLIVQGLRNSLEHKRATPSIDGDPPLVTTAFGGTALEAIRRADGFRRARQREELRMEHLLIGIYDIGFGIARSVLDQSGLHRARLTEILDSAEADIPNPDPYSPSDAERVPPLSAEVEQALQHTREIEEREDPRFSINLLIGALRVKESQVIKRLTDAPEGNALLDVISGTVTETGSPLEATVLEESIHLASASDQPTTKDSLGFEPYVDAIAKFLASEDTKPPLTLSIEGEWGSGKSSFMLMLEETLRAQSKPSCLTLRFNAWRHDKEDALWAAFALEFLRRIRRQCPVLARWLGDFRLFFSRYHWWEGWGELIRVAAIWTAFVLLAGTLFVAFVEQGPDLLGKVLDDKTGGLIGFVGRLGGGAGALAVIAVAFLKIKELLGSPLELGLRKYLRSPGYEDRVAFVERFHEDFDRIVRAYAGDRKVYVFIDDLDRCEIPKAADLMQALNLLIADDPRLIFIVGMDREKVAAGLAVKYEKLLPYLMTQDTSASPDGSGPWPPPEPQRPQPSLEAATRRFGLEYGYSFLEKFIQLPFRVPAPQPDDLGRFLTTISPEPPSAKTPAGNGRKPAATAASGGIPQSGGVGGTRAEGDRQSAALGKLRVAPEIAAARKERVRVNFGADSAAVRTVALMVAPALENNPRRLKQFVNLFRLKAYVANETGLFDELGGRAQLTFEQLAKFVAVGLAWPALLADLDEDATLLGRLEGSATGRLTLAPQDERAQRWAGRRRLNVLLRFGCVVEGEASEGEPGRYGFAEVNVDALLRVSPRVVRAVAPPPAASVRPAASPAAPRPEAAVPPEGDVGYKDWELTGVWGDDRYGERSIPGEVAPATASGNLEAGPATVSGVGRVSSSPPVRRSRTPAAKRRPQPKKK